MAVASTVVEAAAIGLLLYTLYGAVYRLVLSPLAKFPGPKLAALTLWYEFYYDVIQQGSYVYEVEKMHDKYGPIVRINPYELHVRDNDLEWINRLYPTVGKEVDKFWWSAGLFGSTELTFGTIPHGLHKMRRNAFSKFFSPAAIRRLEPTLQGIVNSMCTHIEKDLALGKKVDVMHAYSALSQDVITEYCFATSRGVIEMDDFMPTYYHWMRSHCVMTPVVKQFPWLIPSLNMLPDWWIKATNPMVWDLRLQHRQYQQQITEIFEEKDESERKTHQTIFHELKNDKELPEAEKTPHRLTAEASGLVGAGSITTADMLALTTFLVLNDANILKKAMAELQTAMPERTQSANINELEKLPYLSALVDEGLRLSYGVMARLTRVHRDVLQYRDWVIPPETPVGMTPYFLNMDPEVFPEPRRFNPDRWLSLEPKERERKTKYLMNFGKGSRQCAGMRLAYAEMYLALAYVIRRLGDRVKLFDTEYGRDVEYVRDYFIPAPSPESRGIRIESA